MLMAGLAQGVYHDMGLATRLDVSPATIKRDLRLLLDRLGVCDRHELADLARGLGYSAELPVERELLAPHPRVPKES